MAGSQAPCPLCARRAVSGRGARGGGDTGGHSPPTGAVVGVRGGNKAGLSFRGAGQ